MALPTSAIDQLRRDPSRTPGWSGRLLMFSGTVLFLSIIAYLSLQYGYRPYLEKEIKDHQAEAQKFSQEIPATLQNQIIQFYSQLANLKTLLGNHTQASHLFDFLENKTVSAVYFEKLNLNGTTRELQLSGKARTVQDVGTELQILQADPAVQKVVMKTLTADPSGWWNFDLSLFLAPSVFGQPTSATNASSTQ